MRETRKEQAIAILSPRDAQVFKNHQLIEREPSTHVYHLEFALGNCTEGFRVPVKPVPTPANGQEFPIHFSFPSVSRCHPQFTDTEVAERLLRDIGASY
jgi:hypothetical protein